MGIGFSPRCDASWSYSGFHSFRTKLALEAGIVLELMDGFTQDGHRGLSWDKIQDDIKPLLNHSDCDGELTEEECRQVYSRLRDLVSGWANSDDLYIQYNYKNAMLLADGMERCANNAQSLIFC